MLLVLAGLHWLTITAPCQVDPFQPKINDQVVVGYAFAASSGGETLTLVESEEAPSGPGITFHGTEDADRVIPPDLLTAITDEADRLGADPAWDPTTIEATAP